ncbi:hypothetical protein AHAS_Ahas06G0049000 [Arachis hypogaea]
MQHNLKDLDNFNLSENLEVRQLSRYDPCTEKYAEIYYNRSDVQKALHANTTGIPYKWTACIEVLNRNWNDTDVSVLPIYRQLMANRIRVWVFSGDVDSVVPVTATRYALAQLKVATKIPWYPWYVKNQRDLRPKYQLCCQYTSVLYLVLRAHPKLQALLFYIASKEGDKISEQLTIICS